MDRQALHCYETSRKGCCVFILVTPRFHVGFFFCVVHKYIIGVIDLRIGVIDLRKDFGTHIFQD